MFRIVITRAGLLLIAVDAVPATAGDAMQAQHMIVMDQMACGPMPTGVRAGDITEWVNHDIFERSATAGDGSFDVELMPGATVRTTAKGGIFVFFCKFYTTMQATLVVK
jgi:plastocyanin